jgi:hypothetical protein
MERAGEPISILDATVQELQLELLRRTSFNSMYGERVCKSLLDNRSLWTSALFDRLPHWTDTYRHLPPSWLVKLRDLDRNIWNVDHLILLTDALEKARALVELTETDDWFADVTLYDDPDLVSMTLGRWRHPQFIVTESWD